MLPSPRLADSLLCDAGVNDLHSLLFHSLRVDEADSARVAVDAGLAEPPRLPFSFVVAWFPALFVAELFASRPAATVLRDSEELRRALCVPADTGEKWLCCMDCCRCAVCFWNDSGRDVLCVPKKCCEALL